MQPKYIRNGKTITTFNDDEVTNKETFKSISEAKRKSRGLQLAEDGALGRGSLIVD